MIVHYLMVSLNMRHQAKISGKYLRRSRFLILIFWINSSAQMSDGLFPSLIEQKNDGLQTNEAASNPQPNDSIHATLKEDSLLNDTVYLGKKENSILPSNDTSKRIEELERLQVSAKNMNYGTSKVTMTTIDFQKTAGTANDINRILSANPSVTTYSTIENNGLFVRGGTPRENIYLVDGIEMSGIDHFFTPERGAGAFGLLNIDCISKADLFTGLLPLSMHSKISSAIDIKLKDGMKDKPLGKISFDLSGIGLLLDGATSENKFTYLANFRYIDMGIFEKIAAMNDIPRFGDAIIKITNSPNGNNKFELLGIASHDFIQAIPVWLIDATTATYFKKLDQYTVATLWSASHSRFGNNLSLSYSRSIDEYYLERSGINEKKSGIKETKYESYPNRIYTTKNRTTCYRLKNETTLDLLPTTEFEVGCNGELNLHYAYHDDDLMSRDTSFPSMAVGTYAQFRRFFGIFELLGGIRLDYFSLVDDFGLSPQLDAAFNIGQSGRISLQFDLAYQIPEVIDTKIWTLVMPYDTIPVQLKSLNLERCWKYDIGYNRTFAGIYNLSAGLYFKWYDREYPYACPESQDFGWALISKQGIRQISASKATGKKRAFGGEIALKRNNDGPIGFGSFLALSKVQNQFVDKLWYNDRNDVIYNLGASINASIHEDHMASIRFSFIGGRPYNDTLCDDKRRYFEKRFKSLPLVSFRYSYEHNWKNFQVKAYLDLLNVFNQRGRISREWDMDYYYDRSNDGFIPSGGCIFSF
jgi:hypothetical protein